MELPGATSSMRWRFFGRPIAGRSAKVPRHIVQGSSLGTAQASARSMMKAPSISGQLFWRAKLAAEQGYNRRQLQRINPIAFQAAKRPWPFTVNGHHQHHIGTAVLASLGW